MLKIFGVVSRATRSGWQVVAGLPWHGKVALLSAALTLLPASAAAVTTISQGYFADSGLAPGTLVSLVQNSTDHVTATNSANVNNILGIALDGSNSLLTLSSGQSSQVQVATSGIVQVLVSDINGKIATGDQITASPIDGVGMKATGNIKVVGIAQGDMNQDNSKKQSYKDKQGKQHSVQIAQIPVLISVSYFYKQPDKTIIPSAIQNIANALAGKPVNTVPILISVAIFVVTLIVVASILYSMIRSSIISVCRNPMSQSAVYRDLVQMSALVLVIITVSFASIYLILTKL